MVTKMCKTCKRLIRGDKCSVCKTSTLTDNWKGKVIIVDANKSEIAKKMELTEAGEYAIR